MQKINSKSRSAIKMISMKDEDRLEGASNFIPWKSRVLLLLEENDLLQYVKAKVPEPEAKEDKPPWGKDGAKARRILVDSVRDHLVAQISEKSMARRMFKTLKKLFEHSSINVTHIEESTVEYEDDKVREYFLIFHEDH